MSGQSRIRIFISSPADVRAERVIAERVIRRLEREFAHHVRVEPVMWEREPLTAGRHFQDPANIPPPSTCDIVVVVLWSRLGLKLPAEQFRGALSGGPVTGTEWEFEDALSSYRERQLPDLLVYRKRAPLSASLDDEAELAQRLAQKRLVEDFFQRWFRSADGNGFTAASWEFATTLEFEEQVETHLHRLVAARVNAPGSGGAVERRWFDAPFRGLASFEVEHAPVFFGRRRAQHALREALARQAAAGTAFVCVVGASGSGKSSLVKAGLLADLRDAGMVGRLALCRIAILRPGDAVDGRVVALLARVLLAEKVLPELAQPAVGESVESLSRLLAAAPEHAAQPLRQALAVASSAAHLTEHAEARIAVVVDQLEELFTLEAIDAAERRRFAEALAALARSGLAYVIATLRSDFQDRIELEPALATLLAGDGRYALLPANEAEIGQMIRQPAREAGVRFEADPVSGTTLDAEILAAASASPEALPLLSFVLDQLWQRRDGEGVLTHAAYHALGGFAGALGRRAEEVFQALPPEVQSALPQVLWALTTPAEGAQFATGRPVLQAQFAPGTAAPRLIAALAAPEARLLVLDGSGVATQLRVAHEALLTHWERARAQLETDREDRALRGRLAQAAALWQATPGSDRASRLLAPGRPLAEAEDLLARRRAELDPTIAGFVEASTAASRVAADAERERQRREIRRTRIAAAALAALLLLALAAGGYAWQQRGVADAAAVQAREQEEQARAQRDLAQQRAAEAARSRELAIGAANTLVIQVAERLRLASGVSLATMQALLRAAEAEFDRIQVEAGDSPQLRHRRAVAIMAIAEVHSGLGEGDAALRRLNEAMPILVAVAEQNPDDADMQHSLHSGYISMGAVLSERGEPGEALRSFEASLGVAERMVGRDGNNPVGQNDLYISQQRIGDVRRARGDLAGAQRAYQTSLAIIQRVADADPGHLGWQGNLSVAHEKIGDVLRDRRDFAAALQSYQASLAIAQRVAAQSVDSAARQRSLAAIRDKVGDMQLALRDLQAAQRSYEASRVIRERLAASDPQNTVYLRDLSITHSKIGDTLMEREDFAAALRAYEQSLAITERLAAQDQRDAVWQRDWSVDLQKVGDALQLQGIDLARALRSYQQSREIRERLVAQEPRNPLRHRDVLLSVERIGRIRERQGNLAEAQAAYRSAMAIATRLREADPGDATYARYQAQLQESLTRVERVLSAPAAATPPPTAPAPAAPRK